MMLALFLALMMAAAVLAVLWPLSRGREAASRSVSDNANDVAIYSDQLDEIARDRAAGMIGSPEAEAAKVEVSRRLIAAAQTTGSTEPPDDVSARRWRRRATAVAAIVLMPISAGTLYLTLGSPGLPGQALSGRMDERDQTSLPAMIARIETHLEQSPQDGRGWEVIAPVYMRLGRYDDAVRADRNAVLLLGETSARLGDLGEALISQANGVITAEAKTLFEKIALQDVGDARAQFYIGLAAEQDGRVTDAARTWRGLIAQAPPDAPWIGAVREALGRLDHRPPKITQDPEGPEVPGPSAEDVASAAAMPASDRDRMVRSMVDRLEVRLHEDGSDVEGWLRLMRARIVLGERDKAAAAAMDARRALKNAPDKLRQVDDGAKSIGLASSAP